MLIGLSNLIKKSLYFSEFEHNFQNNDMKCNNLKKLSNEQKKFQELLEKDSIIASLQGKVDGYQRRQRSESPGASGSFLDDRVMIKPKINSVNVLYVSKPSKLF